MSNIKAGGPTIATPSLINYGTAAAPSNTPANFIIYGNGITLFYSPPVYAPGMAMGGSQS